MLGDPGADVGEPSPRIDVVELGGDDNRPLTSADHLFAGSEGGTERWATVASLIATCKINDVEPQAYLTDIFTRLVSGHLQSRLDELLPWAYAPMPVAAAAAA